MLAITVKGQLNALQAPVQGTFLKRLQHAVIFVCINELTCYFSSIKSSIIFHKHLLV